LLEAKTEKPLAVTSGLENFGDEMSAVFGMAEPTGLEPATSDVTGRRSNQLNYDSALSNFENLL
jgi:hypothetical protein